MTARDHNSTINLKIEKREVEKRRGTDPDIEYLSPAEANPSISPSLKL